MINSPPLPTQNYFNYLKVLVFLDLLSFNWPSSCFWNIWIHFFILNEIRMTYICVPFIIRNLELFALKEVTLHLVQSLHTIWDQCPTIFMFCLNITNSIVILCIVLEYNCWLDSSNTVIHTDITSAYKYVDCLLSIFIL